jgi:hypothetical protein
VNTLIPHTRTNVQNLVQFIGIVREKYQNKLTVIKLRPLIGMQPLAQPYLLPDKNLPKCI